MLLDVSEEQAQPHSRSEIILEGRPSVAICPHTEVSKGADLHRQTHNLKHQRCPNARKNRLGSPKTFKTREKIKITDLGT